jgi:hypothetical protein
MEIFATINSGDANISKHLLYVVIFELATQTALSFPLGALLSLIIKKWDLPTTSFFLTYHL